MNIEQLVNINANWLKVENLLIEFEQIPQTQTLLLVRDELKIITQRIRKFFQLRNILTLMNELTIIVSSAVEKITELTFQDVDLLLYITDLIKTSCEIDYINLNEISTITDGTAKYYIEQSKSITSKIPLLRKTAYLKFDEIPINIQAETNDDMEIIDNDDETNKIRINKIPREYANLESIEALNKIEKNIDTFDDYINKLNVFTKAESNEPKHSKNKHKKIEYKDINTLISQTIDINTAINNIARSKEYINKIYELLNTNEILNEQKISSEPIHSFEQYVVRMNLIKSNIDCINNIFIDNIANSIPKLNDMYKYLKNMYSKPLSSFTFWLKEYIDILSAHYNVNVKLEIANQNANITADLWNIFEKIFPIIIKHIIAEHFATNNHNNKEQKNIIKIALNSYSGIIKLLITDNGRKIIINEELNKLSALIQLTKNEGGNVLLKNDSNLNSINFIFQTENCINNYLILDISNNFFAIPAEFCSNIKPDATQNKTNKFKSIHLRKYFENTLVFANSQTNNINKNKKNASVTLKYNSSTINLLVDNIIGTANLSPQRLKGSLSLIPFTLGTAEFENKAVLLVDFEEIISKN